MTKTCHIGADQDRQPVDEPGIRDGQAYQLVGVALDRATLGERVVYRGVGGPDDGRLFLCGKVFWEDHFK